MTKNMTQGSPLKHILIFSLPLLVGNLFQQTYNMVDTAIVGQFLGAKALAGVGCSGGIQFLVLGFCIGICTGFSIPIAQRFGANDIDSMRQYIFIGSISLCAFALVITTICAFLCSTILTWMNTPQDIFSDAFSYLFIIFLGIPFMLLYNFLSGILRAVGDSKTPFVFLVISTVINVGLDLLFVLVIKFGVAGAALATVISQALSGFLCLIYILKKFEVLHFRSENKKWDWLKCKTLIGMGVPMGLQFSITAIGSMILQAANNVLGSLYVSGFVAATKIKQFLMCPYDAFGTAVSTYASQNYGAGNAKNIKKGIFQGTLISVSYGVIASLIMLFFGKDLSKLFISSNEDFILSAAGKYTMIMVFFYWTLGILNVLRPTVQGLGYSRTAMLSGVIEMIARCTVAFGFVPKFAYTAVCAADPIAWICANCFIIPLTVYVIHKISRTMEKTLLSNKKY